MADEKPDETLGSILEPGERVVYDSFMVKPTRASRKRGLVLWAILGGPFMILLFGIKYGLSPFMVGLGLGAYFYFLAYRTRTVLTESRFIYTEGRKKAPRFWQIENISKITRYGNRAGAWFRVHIVSGEQVHSSHLPKAQCFWDALPPNIRDPRSDELTHKYRILSGTYAVLLCLSFLPLWLVPFSIKRNRPAPPPGHPCHGRIRVVGRG